eukprot:3468546-Pyramimonas_sp.AAC.2
MHDVPTSLFALRPALATRRGPRGPETLEPRSSILEVRGSKIDVNGDGDDDRDDDDDVNDEDDDDDDDGSAR